MLLTHVTTEARALISLAEGGKDPEPTALGWAAATVTEVRAMVREVHRLRPDLIGSQWYGDFLSAHAWNAEHGVPCEFIGVSVG